MENIRYSLLILIVLIVTSCNNYNNDTFNEKLLLRINQGYQKIDFVEIFDFEWDQCYVFSNQFSKNPKNTFLITGLELGFNVPEFSRIIIFTKDSEVVYRIHTEENYPTHGDGFQLFKFKNYAKSNNFVLLYQKECAQFNISYEEGKYFLDGNCGISLSDRKLIPIK